MTVLRSALFPPLRSALRSPLAPRKGGGFDWYPGVLYQPGDILLWYDPSDLTTMFQDVAGTSPVTADGQSVALMLDKGGLSDGRGVVNYLTFSEQFDNSAWPTKTNVTVTANDTAAPDGTATADLVLDNTTSGQHRIFRGVVTLSGAVVYSIYAKAATASWFQLLVNDGVSSFYANFNSSTGAVGFTFGGVTATTVSAGGGWYRCTMVVPTSGLAGGNVQIVLTNNNPDATSVPSYVGTTTGIHIWGAQLEQASTASAYQPNGATVGGPGYHRVQATPSQAPKYKTDGTLHWLLYDGTDDGNVTPTINWNLVTSDGAARRNLLVNPTQLNHSTWITGFLANGTRTNGSVSVSADNGYAYVRQNGISGSAGNWVLSFDAVCDQTIANVPLNWSDGSTNNPSLVNFSAGVLQRISIPATLASFTLIHLGIDLRDGIVPGGSNETGYTVTFNNVQLELGSTATAFQNIGSDEVAICAGVTKSSDAAAGMFAELSASSGSNTGTFALIAPGSASPNYTWRSKGSTDRTVNLSPYASPLTSVLTGIGDISANRADLRVNGVLDAGTPLGIAGTGNFGNYPLYFGRRGGSSLPFNGKEHQTVIRSRLLSASELAKLETFVAAKTGVILP